jgi:hypothetical protein
MDCKEEKIKIKSKSEIKNNAQISSLDTWMDRKFHLLK